MKKTNMSHEEIYNKREIKYQGVYTKENGKIDIINLSGINWDRMTGLCEWQKGSLEWCGFETFRQFTGIKDKNGKEIYEGDVVRFDVEASGRDGEPKYTNKIGEVKIENYRLNFDGWDSIYCSNKEVIGNIFENPELIN